MCSKYIQSCRVGSLSAIKRGGNIVEREGVNKFLTPITLCITKYNHKDWILPDRFCCQEKIQSLSLLYHQLPILTAACQLQKYYPNWVEWSANCQLSLKKVNNFLINLWLMQKRLQINITCCIRFWFITVFYM